MTARRIILGVVTLYACWLGMLAVHESGHMLMALIGGGHIQGVSFPLLGFSQTFVDPNPHPLAETWGGPIGGVVFPSVALLIGWLIRRRVPSLLWFFTGFCLVSNGSYIGLGWMMRSGDAHDLTRLGMPISVLAVFGTVCFVLGMLCLHQIPTHSRRVGPNHIQDHGI